MSPAPDMAVTVGGVRLANPVLAASGTFGYGQEYRPYLEPKAIGGLVTKGVSLRPRVGNPPPRIVETACGMLNAIGLANVGLEEFLAHKLPWLAAQPGAVVVNLYGESVAEFAELAQRLGGGQGGGRPGAQRELPQRQGRGHGLWLRPRPGGARSPPRRWPRPRASRCGSSSPPTSPTRCPWPWPRPRPEPKR